jgi:hypothetical protein
MGSTAIDAIVSDAPTSDTSPNVIPAAASAIASGNNRGRFRNTSSNTTPITKIAAASSPAIDPVIVDARSLVTTGTPETVYVP